MSSDQTMMELVAIQLRPLCDAGWTSPIYRLHDDTYMWSGGNLNQQEMSEVFESGRATKVCADKPIMIERDEPLDEGLFGQPWYVFHISEEAYDLLRVPIEAESLSIEGHEQLRAFLVRSGDLRSNILPKLFKAASDAADNNNLIATTQLSKLMLDLAHDEQSVIDAIAAQSAISFALNSAIHFIPGGYNNWIRFAMNLYSDIVPWFKDSEGLDRLLDAISTNRLSGSFGVACEQRKKH